MRLLKQLLTFDVLYKHFRTLQMIGQASDGEGWITSYQPYGFQMPRPRVACAVRHVLAGAGEGIIAGYVAGVSVQVVLER